MTKGLLVIKPSKSVIKLLSFIDDNINSLKKTIQINLVVYKPPNKKIDKLLSNNNITHLPVLFIDKHVIVGCTKIQAILERMIPSSKSPKGDLEEEEADYSSYIKGTGMLNQKKEFKEEDDAEKTKKELDTLLVNYNEKQTKEKNDKQPPKKVEDPMGHGEGQDLTSDDAITEQHNRMLVDNWSEG